MNIPGIAKVEFIEERYITIPLISDPSIPISLEGTTIHNWETLEAFPGSVGLASSGKDSKAGIYFTINMNGFIPGINTTSLQLLTRLFQRKHIYKVTDVNGQKYLIGNNEFRPKFEYASGNGPAPTGKRGYSFKITLKSPFDLLFIE